MIQTKFVNDIHPVTGESMADWKASFERKDIALTWVRENAKTTVGEMAKGLHVEDWQANTMMRRLRRQGLITRFLENTALSTVFRYSVKEENEQKAN